jgi:hypothetical protein
MEPLPPPPPSGPSKMPTWPIVLSLLYLLLSAITGGPGSLLTAVPTVLVLNGAAALFIRLSGGKMPYGKALFFGIILSFLVVLLIGLGMCALQK